MPSCYGVPWNWADNKADYKTVLRWRSGRRAYPDSYGLFESWRWRGLARVALFGRVVGTREVARTQVVSGDIVSL